MPNTLKILNDPIYGFIQIPNSLVFDIIEDSYFQRLRRIAQMGLSSLVYPGAIHTRFHHALGCIYLMQKAVRVLRFKQVDISDEEENALYVAILLHDIGHGPFSHALEHSLVRGVSHEEISLQFMHKLNQKFDGKLTLAIQIFEGKYPRKFLCQLISSQLDIDRLDYLKRLNERYEAWISTYNQGKVLILDIDEIDFANDTDDANQVINKIEAELNGLF
jgi:HD superfamily phosphohydrolase